MIQKNDFEITRAAVDQHGNRWAQVEKNGKAEWISLARYTESDIYGIRRFNKIGVVLLTSSYRTEVKAALQDQEPNEEIFVASKPGYVTVGKGPKERFIGYAYASGELFGCDKPDDPEVIVTFEPHPDFGTDGKFQDFNTGMAPLIKGQALPILMLTLAMSPILQPFVPGAIFVENMVIDLCGKGTKLKSAIAVSIAGAVWGCSKRKTGFFFNGNATPNKIEQSLPIHNNALMGRDETTLIGDDASTRGKALGNLIHRISAGTTKDRVDGIEPEEFRLQAIFTSNQGLRDISSENQVVLDALETRVVTVNIPDRETGAFDFLPSGFPTTRSIQAQLYTTGLAHYGHIARRLIAKTLQEADNDINGLRDKIGSLMTKFMNNAGQERLDDRHYRTLKLFALCFATGTLAKKWGVLDEDMYGMFKDPLLRAWALAQTGQGQNDRYAYHQYLHKHAEAVVVVDNQDRPEMDDDEFSKTKAFILTQRDGQKLACFPAKRMAKRFPGFETAWKRLREGGQIVADSGLQSGQRIRIREGEVFKDKVYALRIDDWPLK